VTLVLAAALSVVPALTGICRRLAPVIAGAAATVSTLVRALVGRCGLTTATATSPGVTLRSRVGRLAVFVRGRARIDGLPGRMIDVAVVTGVPVLAVLSVGTVVRIGRATSVFEVVPVTAGCDDPD